MTATHAAAAVMFAAFLAELFVSRVVKRDRAHDTKDTTLNLVIGGGYVVMSTLQRALTVGVLLAVWAAAPLKLDMREPWHWVLLLIAEDFLYYWSHRASHQLRFMWVSHVVHHNSPVLNMSTGMRNSWVGGFIDWVFWIPLAAMGFHPLAIAMVLAVATAWDFLTHTPYFGKNRVLDLVFNSPSNHRVHHAADAADADSNFGGFLIVWDRLFGTYRAEGERIDRYGTDEMPSRPHNPFYVELYLWGRLLRSLWSKMIDPLRSLG